LNGNAALAGIRNIAVSVFVGLTAVYGGQTLSAADVHSEWLSKKRAAAEQGDSDAQVTVGLQYALGLHGQERDDAEAVRWWRRAAQAGNPDGEVLLGNAYLDGRGIKKDEAEAAKWWRKAADAGSVDGEALLGEAYYGGIGMGKNQAEGLRRLREAAKGGSSIAQIFLNSIGTQSDPK
jgi:hypothetical protein